MENALGQCKARPFKFHRVYFFISLFLYFSTLTHCAFSTLIAELLDPGSLNLGLGSTLMMSGSTLKIKVIGQRSGSRGQKLFPDTLPLLTSKSTQIEPSVQHAFR